VQHRMIREAIARRTAAKNKAFVSFYEKVTGQIADWLAPVFAKIVTPAATLTIGSAETVTLFAKEIAPPSSSSRSAEAEFARLKDELEVVHGPKTMPWGNRTAQFRDPEGTPVALYTPVTKAAKKRFGSR
jgi:hypothetical protein